jgi:RIO kinase 1
MNRRPSPAVAASRDPSAATATTTPNNTSSKAPVHSSKLDSALAQLQHRYASHVNFSPLDALNNATNNTATRKGGSERVLHKDKSDRATNEQVLDPRTRLVLFKMMGRGLIARIDGCVSTGKEANVYHALSGELLPTAGSASSSSPLNNSPLLPLHLALKIYKTSILTFKDRDRYVTGEFRFRSGYSRSNPRKMVRLWAEKEMRNLRRMRGAGLKCPQPIEVRGNVLVMEFLGQGGDSWELVLSFSVIQYWL